MIKNVLRTSILAAAMTVATAVTASAQVTAQHDLELSGTAASQLTVAAGPVTLTVPAFAAGDASKSVTATSSYSFVTTDSAQAITVELASGSTLPTNSTLSVTLAGGTKVAITATPTVARTGITAASESGSSIDYEYVTSPDTPIAPATVTIVYTLGAQP